MNSRLMSVSWAWQRCTDSNVVERFVFIRIFVRRSGERLVWVRLRWIRLRDFAIKLLNWSWSLLVIFALPRLIQLRLMSCKLSPNLKNTSIRSATIVGSSLFQDRSISTSFWFISSTLRSIAKTRPFSMTLANPSLVKHGSTCTIFSFYVAV